ncbi:hypothetical protein BASA81_005327 [Batrachochytrium salamandrivorans]|nr:hypothetical protein BASA81_005327 [Batrachochytrium salamandrivorans]
MFLRASCSWAVPFLSSFLFFTTSLRGVPELAVSKLVFKNCMTVGSSLLFAVLLNQELQRDGGGILQVMGGFCLANLGLDMAILVPMTGMTLEQWFKEIGVLYVVYFAILGGFALGLRHPRQQQQPPRVAHKFVVVAIPLICLIMRIVQRYNLLAKDEYLAVALLWGTGGAVGACFLLSIGQKHLQWSVAFTLLVWIVELVLTRWPVEEYLAVRGYRLLGLMLAMGIVGRGFERSPPRTNPQAAAAAIQALVGHKHE